MLRSSGQKRADGDISSAATRLLRSPSEMGYVPSQWLGCSMAICRRHSARALPSFFMESTRTERHRRM
jgi:hypothetical protein